jgi:hypothetical protein
MSLISFLCFACELKSIRWAFVEAGITGASLGASGFMALRGGVGRVSERIVKDELKKRRWDEDALEVKR